MSADERDIVERLRDKDGLPVCPFDRRSPDYWTTANDKPCHVCGGTEEVDKCRGADLRVMDDAAAEIERLRGELADEKRNHMHWYEEAFKARDASAAFRRQVVEATKLPPELLPLEELESIASNRLFNEGARLKLAQQAPIMLRLLQGQRALHNACKEGE